MVCLTYEELMLLGDKELNRRFLAADEQEQKEKRNQEQAQELEYAEEVADQKDKQDIKEKTETKSREAKRKPLKGEDSVTARM